MKTNTQSTKTNRETFHLVKPNDMHSIPSDLGLKHGFRIDAEVLSIHDDGQLHLLNIGGALLLLMREPFPADYLLPGGETVTAFSDDICGFLAPDEDTVKPCFYVGYDDLGEHAKRWISDWWTSLLMNQREELLANLEDPGTMPELFALNANKSA